MLPWLKYYYNEDTGELEFICADEVAQDGTVSFAFTHASDYVVVVNREVKEAAPESDGRIIQQPEGEDVDSSEPPASPKEIGEGQDGSILWFVLTGYIAVILITAGILIWKRKKKGESGEPG